MSDVERSMSDGEHDHLTLLDPNAREPLTGRILGFLSASSSKQWFRGGYTCGCVVDSLPWVEIDLIIHGHIGSSIDIFQLGYRGNVAASAGTHKAGGNTDVAQYNDDEIDIWRLWGWTMQNRAPYFPGNEHGHGWPWGCSHLADEAHYQIDDWLNRKNGLADHGPVHGRWPVQHWTDAKNERMKTLMSFKDDVANAAGKAAADEVLKRGKDIAAAVWNTDGIIDNSHYTKDPKNTTIAPKSALAYLGDWTRDVAHRVLTTDGQVANEYNPADPNTTLALASAVGLLMRRQREHDDLLKQMKAELDKLANGI